jgi:hypothetical protein
MDKETFVYVDLVQPSTGKTVFHIDKPQQLRTALL